MLSPEARALKTLVEVSSMITECETYPEKMRQRVARTALECFNDYRETVEPPTTERALEMLLPCTRQQLRGMVAATDLAERPTTLSIQRSAQAIMTQ